MGRVYSYLVGVLSDIHYLPGQRTRFRIRAREGNADKLFFGVIPEEFSGRSVIFKTHYSHFAGVVSSLYQWIDASVPHVERTGGVIISLSRNLSTRKIIRGKSRPEFIARQPWD